MRRFRARTQQIDGRYERDSIAAQLPWIEIVKKRVAVRSAGRSGCLEFSPYGKGFGSWATSA